MSINFKTDNMDSTDAPDEDLDTVLAEPIAEPTDEPLAEPVAENPPESETNIKGTLSRLTQFIRTEFKKIEMTASPENQKRQKALLSYEKRTDQAETQQKGLQLNKAA